MAAEEYNGFTWHWDDRHGVEVEPHAMQGERKPPNFFALLSRLASGKKPKTPKIRPERPDHFQRCVVRINYAKGGTVGKWYSVGRYISRESASDKQVAFSETRDDIDMAREMAHWRRAGDEQFFKVIISPEFGDKLNLTDLTKQTMERVQLDYGKLEWMAVEHHNTDNPHVHVVIRGIDQDGDRLRFSRDYVQAGFRRHAENICTNMLGYRTEQNIIDAQQREVRQARFTGLDRKLQARATETFGRLGVHVPQPKDRFNSLASITDQNLRARLRALQDMNLAETAAKDSWMIYPNFEQSLRAMQRTVDRQKMMSNHGLMSSDKALPFRALKTADLVEVEGRVLVHGQEEQGNGIRNYMLLESVNGEILQVPHVREIGRLRHHGNLEPGTYVSVKKMASEDDTPPSFDVQERGDADSLLMDSAFLKANAERLSASIPEGYGGWLGKMREAAKTQQTQAQTAKQAKPAVGYSR